MNPMLEIRSVNFARGERKIFSDLNLSVANGGMTALLGPNGVGKSTLLNMVSGLLAPDSGSIRLSGRAIGDWERQELSRTVALVPQSLFVPFSFRVEEIVAQGRVPYLGRFGNMSGHDLDVVERAMEAVDVLSLRKRVYEELSGGEMQRVKVGIALAQEPKLMLLDEPTQHLDIGRQIEILQLLRKLNAKGITIFAAIHDLSLARQGFTSAVLLTPEPACFAGPAQEIMRPELLERAFRVSGGSLAEQQSWSDESIHEPRTGQNCRTTPRHRRQTWGSRREP
jgi:ABC-type cobalamin/Fe3+-siderophores transport system ATPase subunit